jgi:2-polyprenyl-3-methyl-5-hydroxy-6-metoxy-1,4-benzoquinol methylase
MAETILDFYEPLADYYHLIFEDWNESIERQARVLNPIIASEISPGGLRILDCACGIGTQAIGFAKAGHQVVASDLSQAAVTRAKRETEIRGLSIKFYVSDMTSLAEIEESGFNVVAALDNALPHLVVDEVRRVVRAMGSKLGPGGLFIASTRDYDQLMTQRPTMQEPIFYGKEGERRIVHQVWEWIDDARYIVHLYITTQSEKMWTSHHFVSEYRCLLREELSNALEHAGFLDVRWLMPGESGFYQPLVLARKGV